MYLSHSIVNELWIHLNYHLFTDLDNWWIYLVILLVFFQSSIKKQINNSFICHFPNQGFGNAEKSFSDCKPHDQRYQHGKCHLNANWHKNKRFSYQNKCHTKYDKDSSQSVRASRYSPIWDFNCCFTSNIRENIGVEISYQKSPQISIGKKPRRHGSYCRARELLKAKESNSCNMLKYDLYWGIYTVWPPCYVRIIQKNCFRFYPYMVNFRRIDESV